MAINHLVLLVGGVGGAKLAYGMARLLAPERLTLIVNTGDDFVHYGLTICPDSDTILYTLSGRVDKTNGWGVAGDSTTALETLRGLGEDTWFRLGDRDIALHLLRTHLLSQGHSLTDVTAHLARAMGVQHPVLPVTDDRLATRVDTAEYGELTFQTYFVRYRWQPTVRGLRFDGAAAAHVTGAVRAALLAADALVFAPSNPWLSIAPILAVSGVRDLLLARDIPRIAITPIIGGKAVKGPAAKLMAELGYPASPGSVARYYGELINGFVYDERDTVPDVDGIRLQALDTLMLTETDRVRLAGQVLAWLEKGG